MIVRAFPSCAALVTLVAVWWQPQAMAQDTQVYVLPPDPENGYHGISWDYSGSFLLDLFRSDSIGQDDLIRMSTYPTVSGIRYCSPSHRAGIRLGDEIVGVDGRNGKMAPLFGRGVNPPGTTHTLVVRRDDTTVEISFTRIERPEETAEPAGDRSPAECPDVS